MPNNVSVTGGTAQQQTVIITAHQQAIQQVQAAKQSAQQGTGAFTTWFGPITQTAETTAANIYNALLTFLQNSQFNYDLANQVTNALPGPDVYVVFETVSPPGTTYNGYLWNQFWESYAVNATQAAAQLMLSVIQQAGLWAQTSGVYDLIGTQSADGAALLASLAPDEALGAVGNYVQYLATLPLTNEMARPLHGAGAHPATATTRNYGPDGKTHVSTTTTDFSGAQFNEAGHIVGGVLRMDTRSADGRPLRRSTMDFNQQSEPVGCETMTYLSESKPGQVRTSKSTFREVKFDAQRRIVGGNLSFQVYRPNRTQRSAGTVSFTKDGNAAVCNVVSYQHSGSVRSHAVTDYTAAQFDTTHRLCGGSITSQVYGPDLRLRVRTVVKLNADGSPHMLDSTSYGRDGHTPVKKSHLAYYPDRSYSRIKNIRHRRGRPCSGVDRRYAEGGQLIDERKLDYSEAQFDPSGRIVGGYLFSQLFDRRGGLLTATNTEFDGNQSITAVTRVYGPDHLTIKHVVMLVERPPGTRAEHLEIKLDERENPATVKLVRYAEDGETPVEFSASDYSQVVFSGDHRIRRGRITTEVRRGDHTTKAASSLEYTS